MSRLQGGVDKPTPILTRIATPVASLTVQDLLDTEHPVNCKALSGKSNGMSCMIDDVLYMARSSSAKGEWIVVGGGGGSIGSSSHVEFIEEDLTLSTGSTYAVDTKGGVVRLLVPLDFTKTFKVIDYLGGFSSSNHCIVDFGLFGQGEAKMSNLNDDYEYFCNTGKGKLGEWYYRNLNGTERGKV